MRQLYRKLTEKLDTKKAGIAAGVLFALTLLPVIYVGFFNYATGDDYWYGVHTYRGLAENGIPGALKGSLLTVAEFYENWQGTWFTMFLFTLSPNHFAEGGYVITVFLALGLLIGSYACLGHFYLVKKLGFTKGAAAMIVCAVSYLAIQYIPRTTSGIYWFNGIMHYLVPFFFGVLAIVHSHKFLEQKRKRDYVILFFSFLLLGGGSYLAPLAATLTVLLLLAGQVKLEKKSSSHGTEVCEKNNKESGRKNLNTRFLGCTLNRSKNMLKIEIWEYTLRYDLRNLWIFAAFLAEFLGLLVSFLAPGNSVRGGEEFGMDLKWALECIFYAIDRGIYLGEDYFRLNPVNTMVYLLLALLLWSQLWRTDRTKVKFRLPFLFVIYMNGIYWAVYTPEIYARSDVSGGVPNTYFHIFLTVTLANMIWVHGWVQDRLQKYWQKKAKKKETTVSLIEDASILSRKKYKQYIAMPAMAVGLLLLAAAGKYSDISTTNDYCIQAVKSGELKKYAEVRKKQHRILSQSEKKDETVPEKEAPYPLLHMMLQKDPTDSRNHDRAAYYGKNSVTAEMVE